MTLMTLCGYAVYWYHTRQDVSGRAMVRLREWAASRRFRRLGSFEADAPLDQLGPVELLAGFGDATMRCVRVKVAGPRGGEWNLIIRRLQTSSPPVGLRPTGVARSVTDLLDLYPSPYQPGAVRFTIVGNDLAAARRLADGSSRALLPADLSLVRTGHFLLIDFSSRPFDEISTERARLVAEQVASVM